MNSQLSEVTKYMHKTYDEFESAIKQHREMHPAAGMLEQDLPMFGRYFATLSTSLEMLDKGIPGRKPDSFKIVRTALGKVHGKKPLHYHIRDIGRDYRLKLEGVEELLRFVPEVLTYAEGFALQQVPISQERIVPAHQDIRSFTIKKIPKPDIPYAVIPVEKIGYPSAFENLVKSNDAYFQTLGQTRQASRLKSSWQKVDSDLFSYDSSEGSSSLTAVPQILKGEVKDEIIMMFEKYTSLQNVDEILFGKLTDYGNEMKGYIDRERMELDREIEVRLEEKRSRERIPNGNF
jgi:hypothetical protein